MGYNKRKLLGQGNNQKGNAPDTPLTGFIGVAIFIILVSCNVLIALIICSSYFPIDQSLKKLIFEIFIVLIGVGWFAFSVSLDAGEFFKSWFFFIIICASSIGMVLTSNSYFFWISFLLINAAAVITTLNYDESFGDNFAVSLYVIWIVSGVIITFGNNKILTYAAPASSVKIIRYFLDIRVFISLILFMLFIIKAMWKAVEKGWPNVPNIPKLKFPQISGNQASILIPFIRPMIIIVDSFLAVTLMIVNELWKFAAISSVYFIRLGHNIANQVYELVSSKTLWFKISRVLLTFSFVVGFAYAAVLFVPHMIDYLTRSVPIQSFPFFLDYRINILWILAFFATSFLGIILVGWAWNYENILYRTEFGASMIFVACIIAAFIMYMAARVLESLKISGFDYVGIFSILCLFMIGLAFLYRMTKLIATKNYDLEN